MTVFLGFILWQGQGIACYRGYPLGRIQRNHKEQAKQLMKYGNQVIVLTIKTEEAKGGKGQLNLRYIYLESKGRLPRVKGIAVSFANAV
jgi:hypothetical protein